MIDLAGPNDDAVTAVAKRLAQRVARERIVKSGDVANAITDQFGDGWPRTPFGTTTTTPGVRTPRRTPDAPAA